MDAPKASHLPPDKWSIEQANAADVLVVLLGCRHGGLAELEFDELPKSIPCRKLERLVEQINGWEDVREPGKFSYTQWEVLTALSQGKPVLAFEPNLKSTDHDLKLLGEPNEETWLQDRQRKFVNWLSLRVTGDRFDSRSDLIGKVKKALERLQKKRRYLRLSLVLMLVIGVSAAWGYHRVEAEAKENRAHVLLGMAVSLMGQDRSRATTAVLDVALEHLEYPADSEASWHREYESSYSQIIENPGQALQIQGKFLKDVQKKVQILADTASAERLQFGYDFGVCVLVLRNWDTPLLRHDELLVKHWSSLQRGLKTSEMVSDEEARQFRELSAEKLIKPNEQEQRASAMSLLHNLSARFPK